MKTIAQQAIDSVPSWLNWFVIVGGAVLGFTQWLAAVVAVLWGGAQLYSWIVNKRWRKDKDNG